MRVCVCVCVCVCVWSCVCWGWRGVEKEIGPAAPYQQLWRAEDRGEGSVPYAVPWPDKDSTSCLIRGLQLSAVPATIIA